ncbi:MAG: exodeoxyribonuclease III [Actinomycetaceae bacterium]|nr:exodeoxyribonuclease III [Actinomycetaceae bacterium]
MRIATCNVNGIRAAARKGMGEWIASADADVLLLQEVRAPGELVPPLIGEGYAVHSEVCEIKGRAGVTVAVREGIEVGHIRRGVDGDEHPASTGRWLEVELPEFDLLVTSAYLHSGDAASEEKMALKYHHLDAVTERLSALASQPGHVLVAGDFNIVRSPLDIKNWKPNHNRTSGVLDPEIAYLERWFGPMGFADVQRALDPDSQGPYTWWSQRGKAFANDVGWRIDYHMTDAALAAKATNYRIDRAESYDARFSDHAPLVVDYDI